MTFNLMSQNVILSKEYLRNIQDLDFSIQGTITFFCESGNGNVGTLILRWELCELHHAVISPAAGLRIVTKLYYTIIRIIRMRFFFL
jgi:hypothetical protein